jgi:hypothetical protein
MSRLLNAFALFLGILILENPNGARALSTPAPHATTAGGSHQLGALQGCVDQWVFNGVWRVRVTKVSSIASPFGALPGYSVSLDVRNGSKSDAMLMQTGVSAPVLALADGNILELSTEDGVAWNNKFFENLPPSAGFTISLPYYMSTKPASMPKPQKLIVEIDAKKAWHGQPHYQVGDPSLRIDLNCGANSN